MRRTTTAIGLMLATGLLLAATPTRRADADSLIAARQAAFKLSGATFGGLKATIDAGGDVTKLGFGARALADWAHALPGLFPAGSDGGTTKALPTVWSDRAGFEKAAANFEAEAKKLADLAKAGDTAGVAIQWTVVRERAARATTPIVSRSRSVGRALIVAGLLFTLPAAAQVAPGTEAEALGRKVADTGTLAALLPLLVGKETEEMIGQHPELDDAAKAKLRAVAADTARTAIDRMLGAVGHQYALRLSVDDMKVLAAFNQGSAAKNWRAAEPQVIVATMQTIDGFDFKGEAWSAYCRSPGVTCPAK